MFCLDEEYQDYRYERKGGEEKKEIVLRSPSFYPFFEKEK